MPCWVERAEEYQEHIVPILGYHVDVGGNFSVVMPERVAQARTLGTWLADKRANRDGGVSSVEALTIVRHIVSGLRYMHGVCHRELWVVTVHVCTRVHAVWLPHWLPLGPGRWMPNSVYVSHHDVCVPVSGVCVCGWGAALAVCRFGFVLWLRLF